jgi:hypothetical protein
VERRRPRPFRLPSESSESASPSLSCRWTKNGAYGRVESKSTFFLLPLLGLCGARPAHVVSPSFYLAPPPPETLYFLVCRIQQYVIFETYMSMESSYENACLCTSSSGRLHTDTIMRPLNLVASPQRLDRELGWGCTRCSDYGKLESQNQHSMHTTEPRSRHP